MTTAKSNQHALATLAIQHAKSRGMTHEDILHAAALIIHETCDKCEITFADALKIMVERELDA